MYLSDRLKRIQRGLQISLAVVIALMVTNAFSLTRILLPAFLERLVSSYAYWTLLLLFLGMQVMGMTAASGAFEVVDADTGEVFHSALASGDMPDKQALVARITRTKGASRMDFASSVDPRSE